MNNDGGFFYFIKIIKIRYFFSLCLKQDLKNNLQIFILTVVFNYNKYFLRPTVVVNLLDDCRMLGYDWEKQAYDSRPHR